MQFESPRISHHNTKGKCFELELPTIEDYLISDIEAVAEAIGKPVNDVQRTIEATKIERERGSKPEASAKSLLNRVFFVLSGKGYKETTDARRIAQATNPDRWHDNVKAVIRKIATMIS